jgi:hypothetical protein
MLTDAAWRTLQILLFRAGPQDFPYSVTLTRALSMACAVAIALLLQMLVPGAIALLLGMVATGVVAIVTRTLLTARKLENRFHQTCGALMGVGIVYSLLMLPILMQTAPEFLKIVNDPAVVQRMQEGQAPQIAVPMSVAFGWDVIFFWSIAVAANVYRQAANVNALVAILIVLLLMFMQLSAATVTSALLRSAFG